MTQKPFFSVVIACYNTKPEWMRALLSSIAAGGVEQGDVEVIVVDDGSDDKAFLGVMADFSGKLDIHIVPRERNKTTWNGHGAARQAGLDIARGEWLSFADHDDEFIPGALRRVMNFIQESGEELFVQAPFLFVREDGELIRQIDAENAWNHGKFMHLENLIKAHGIRFRRELATHEDICFQSQIVAAMRQIGRPAGQVDFPVYRWFAHPESASNAVELVECNGAVYEVPYLLAHFDDYLAATYGTYAELYRGGRLSPADFDSVVLTIVLYCYHYSESMRFYFPAELVGGMMESIKRMYHEGKGLSGFGRDDVLLYAASDDCNPYEMTRLSCEVGARRCFPLHTLPEYLDELEGRAVGKQPESSRRVVGE